jgi:hypothetical protein
MQLTATIAGSIPANALKVLVVLMLERVPCNKGYLETVTDMSDKTLAKALDQLMLRGMITHNGGHVYQIAARVEQLPLTAFEDPGLKSGASEERPEDVIEGEAVDNSVDKSRNISDFSTHACKQESDSTQIHKQDPACMPGSRKNSDSELDEALIAAGFREPGLSRLRRQAGLTAREVRYHVSTADSLGLALYRIEHHWRVPKDFENQSGHAAYTNCARCVGYGKKADMARIGDEWVCMDCLSDEEYEQYGPDG